MADLKKALELATRVCEYIEKDADGVLWNWLIPNAQKNMMEPVHILLKANSSTDEDFPHEGEEFGYVLRGEIVLILGKRKIKVKKGESFYFNSGKIHYVKNSGNKTAKFIWISSPPTF